MWEGLDEGPAEACGRGLMADPAKRHVGTGAMGFCPSQARFALVTKKLCHKLAMSVLLLPI